MNKTILISPWFCTFGILLHAQTALQKETFLPRGGDVIVKQELQYKSPGREGKSVVWDFSELSPLDTESQERLYGKIDSSLICLGRDGGYKYKLSGDSLFCIGHQNSTQRIDYLLPALNRIYPMNYRDSIHSLYYGEGMYSQVLPIVVFGETTIRMDAEGVLMLPGDIRINNVLRVRETAHVGQRLSSSPAIYSHGDRSRYSTDSLVYHLRNDSVTWQVTTYKWYAPGYRYPVFETVHTGIIESGNLRPHFNRSYYFPPQSRDYLMDDPANENILAAIQMREDAWKQGSPNQGGDRIPGKENYAYNFFIDPNGHLCVEYCLDDPCSVEILLNAMAGYNIWRQSLSEKSRGMHTATYDTSSLPPGTYLLSLVINGKIHTEKIQK